MMVTFVAQCEKKALAKTRRVLDAFANRIGSRTWQTVITNEGVKAVKKLLRQTATKNTAVSCHWLRSRSRSELMWIVGNRGKFNSEGVVPVNYTEQAIMNCHWENDWHYLPLIKTLVAMAGLFHDWAKASEFFQAKLREAKNIGDPLRHEWLSVVFLQLFINGESDDEQWLTRLANGEIDSKLLQTEFANLVKKNKKPLAKLPKAASFIAWLIISHHRLPVPQTLDGCIGEKVTDCKALFNGITKKWGYENKFADYDEDLERCLEFPVGLPCESEKWLRFAKKTARKLLGCLDLLEKCLADGSWRLVLHHCRLSLMLADHYHSSQPKDVQWLQEPEMYANTDRATKKLKQRLTEHLVGVASQAQRNAHLLPAFEGKHKELQRAFDIKILQKKSPQAFSWQDKAVQKIKDWRNRHDNNLDPDQYGFFAVNMASTGRGKTFANAKVMRALSVDQESLRYILALGLRTLTLQTGDEYRERINLSRDEVAVLIGSKAVLDLHRQDNSDDQAEKDEFFGSESAEKLLENELVFAGNIPDKQLATVLPDLKSRKFLYAPVLSCTIDHLMGATETKRGGRYILPSLRLMSSDLVIDEIDDFDGTDLIAIGRLVHLAGMLGRKVMISSATIPPDLAEGYFNAYQAGWRIFATMRTQKKVIGCAWIDEFSTKVHDVDAGEESPVMAYGQYHQKFAVSRQGKLQKEVVKRKAVIWPCEPPQDTDDEGCQKYFNSVILDAIQTKHNLHHNIDAKTGKQVSFGLVRVANIKPCIALTRSLLETELPQDISIRAMAYHSQQLLIMRHAQEEHLDKVLKRKKGSQNSFDQEIIRHHLDNTSAQQVIFVLVATPVEEVGRDHDFDWAVVEPSSYRSFIQLAGRVLRHHELVDDIGSTNIALLQYNLKGLLRKKEVFCYPGYESEQNQLESHDLRQLLATEVIEERLDAGPRIVKKKDSYPQRNLADLEHEVIHHLLTNYQKQGPESLQGWLDGCWWLTAVPQVLVQFRKGSLQLPVYLLPEDGVFRFVEKDRLGKPVPIEEIYEISRDEELSEQAHERLWLHRDYETLLKKIPKRSLGSAALIYGEITLPTYGGDCAGPFIYSSQLGLMRK